MESNKYSISKYKDVYMVVVKPNTSHKTQIDSSAHILPLGVGNNTCTVYRDIDGEELVLKGLDKFTTYLVTEDVAEVEIFNRGDKRNIAFIVMEFNQEELLNADS